ncbi:hypothetical protein JTE90_022429 [Oedothorax gibbosus]|uniref:Uncharacterized protein n=1 Tax=Oedothorax gibbosus TaxID=931172 RepID=A0AAV6TS59_9ARAC|nr:hypothetical protein JTE90_022429 [Oedothorax gibbosus]
MFHLWVVFTSPHPVFGTTSGTPRDETFIPWPPHRFSLAPEERRGHMKPPLFHKTPPWISTWCLLFTLRCVEIPEPNLDYVVLDIPEHHRLCFPCQAPKMTPPHRTPLDDNWSLVFSPSLPRGHQTKTRDHENPLLSLGLLRVSPTLHGTPAHQPLFTPSTPDASGKTTTRDPLTGPQNPEPVSISKRPTPSGGGPPFFDPLTNPPPVPCFAPGNTDTNLAPGEE